VGLLAVLKVNPLVSLEVCCCLCWVFVLFFLFFWFVGVVIGAFVGFVFWGHSGMELVEGYGWVVIVLILHLLENMWMAWQVGNARKRYKVFYPTMYALESENSQAKLFNCVQRGHQNNLELMPTFISLLLVAGLQVC
jgi:hypothetical protein